MLDDNHVKQLFEVGIEHIQHISKFARCYTPSVVIIALLLTIVPPLFYGFSTFTDWLYRTLSFLVVSCPCALVISIPLSFLGELAEFLKLEY